MYAGSPSVLASLWSVDDDATQKLMIAFYTHLNDGLGKAEALRAAQIDIRQQYSHPYYWAGFVLTGDPGSAKNSLQARTTR
jgi:CHAT domain-containing protein